MNIKNFRLKIIIHTSISFRNRLGTVSEMNFSKFKFFLPFGLDLSWAIWGCSRLQYQGSPLGSVVLQRAAYLLLAAAKAPKWDMSPNLKTKEQQIQTNLHF